MQVLTCIRRRVLVRMPEFTHRRQAPGVQSRQRKSTSRIQPAYAAAIDFIEKRHFSSGAFRGFMGACSLGERR